MKKYFIKVTLFILLILNICTSVFNGHNIAFALENQQPCNYNINMKRDLLCLIMAYPEHIINIENNKDGRVYIVMKSGNKILYDDKRNKNFNEKLSNPDLQDMLEQTYPLSSSGKLMPDDFDPGRIRVYALFKEVYGSSKNQVEDNLISIKTGYGSCTFNKNNGAAKALEGAMMDIKSLIDSNKGLYGFVFPTMGTFNYRLISGTNMLSVHSFGTAIDFATSKWDYWKWAKKEQGQKRLGTYPKEIVEAMENHGFIWGGKWGHFDIMHYEYRPELIIKAKYFSKEPEKGKLWYEGVPLEDDNTKKYIELIEKVLGD